MRTVSERWQQSVPDVNTWVTEIDWSNDGGQTWTEAEFEAGSVTADSTSQIRWTADLEVRAPAGVDGVNGFTTRVRVRHGLEYAPGDRELIGMGLYRVDAVDRADTDPELLKITGNSFESKVIAARFQQPRVFPAADAAGRLDTLITEAVPDAKIWWDRVSSIHMPKLTVDRDRWPTVDGDASSPSLAKSLGARVFCNGDGVFIVAPVPALTDPSAWEATAGEGGVLITSSEQLTAEGVYNQVIASGESTDGTTVPVWGKAEDTDPYSLTYNRGEFGRRPRFYTSAMIRTTVQARAVARAQLAPYLGLKQQVSFDSLHDPRKEPGDVGLIRGEIGDRKVILDAVTYDLTGGPLQAQTRTTATRYGGTFDTGDESSEGGDE